MEIIQLDIVAIRASDTQNNAYVLLLKELRGSRQLPIVIGWCEARSIAIALDGTEENERPLTHDLFKVLTKIPGFNYVQIFYMELITIFPIIDVVLKAVNPFYS